MTSLFISYSRKDIQAARKLTGAFKGQELDFWIDWEGIPPTVDWWKEIEKGIEEADIFLFLISPDSAKSKVCRQEIEHAIKNGKRLIPLVVRDIDVAESPAELSHLNWLFFREHDEFDPAFDKLLVAIKTDYIWVQVHRQLQVKALEWERSSKDNSFLLQGKELQEAEFQLATNTSKEPHPTDLQREYVFKSRQASDVRRRHNRIISIGVIIALAVLSVIAFIQAGLATTRGNEAQEASTRAVANERTAQANEQEAQKQAALAQAGELAAMSITSLDSDPELSLHLAMLSLDTMHTPQGEEALRRALVSPPVELTLLGHSGAVYSVEYDSEGNRLLTAGADGTARLWDAKTGEELIRFEGHKGAVNDAAFSPDGRFVATAGADGTVRIWDANTTEQMRSMKHSAAVNSVAFSPDGDSVVTASDDTTARVWKVTSGKEVFPLDNDDTAVRSALFSPDGEVIATGGYDGEINVWDATTGELLKSLSNYGQGINAIAFDPDSQYILADWVYNAYFWDIRDETWVAKYFGGHTWYLTSFTLSPDGKQVVTASRDHTVGIWDIDSGTTDAESSAAVEVLRGHSGAVYSVSFSPGGDQLATASEDETVRIWNMGEWRKRVLIGNGGYPNRAVYSSDGRQIATSDNRGMIQIWDAQSGRELKAWQSGVLVNRLYFSPDDKQLIISGNDGRWGLWDIQTRKEVYKSPASENIISDARFSQDGTRIISTDRGGKGIIWDARTKQQLVTLDGDNQGIWTGTLSPDGQLAATAGTGNVTRIWDAQTGQTLHVLYGHSDLVTSVVFDPGGTRVVTASVDGTAIIWDVSTGKSLYALKGHTRELTDVAFSPKDPYIATASRDRTVILWNAETGNEVVQLFGHNQDVYSVVFSPDGRYLLTSSYDGTARIYPVYFEDVLALAQSLLSARELTCVGRIKFLHAKMLHTNASVDTHSIT
jgi:WD40 repeat protein